MADTDSHCRNLGLVIIPSTNTNTSTVITVSLLLTLIAVFHPLVVLRQFMVEVLTRNSCFEGSPRDFISYVTLIPKRKTLQKGYHQIIHTHHTPHSNNLLLHPLERKISNLFPPLLIHNPMSSSFKNLEFGNCWSDVGCLLCFYYCFGDNLIVGSCY